MTASGKSVKVARLDPVEGINRRSALPHPPVCQATVSTLMDGVDISSSCQTEAPGGLGRLVVYFQPFRGQESGSSHPIYYISDFLLQVAMNWYSTKGQVMRSAILG